MTKTIRFMLSTLIFLSACSFFDTQYDINNPVLLVNGFPVSQEAFEKMYVRHLIASGANDTRQERYAYLQKMTDKLILGEEAKERGLLNDDNVKAKLAREKKKAYRDFFFLDTMGENIQPITEEENKQAYDRKQQRVYVRQLFFRDMDQADSYYSRLQNGESFIQLANELYKTASFDSTAGFIGELTYFSVEDTYAEVAFSLEAGQYSKPFRNRWGIYIIKVEYKTRQPLLAESQLTLAKAGISSQVRLRKQRIAGDRFIDSLMRTTNPKTNEKTLLQIQRFIRDFHSGKMIRLGESNKDKIRFTTLDSDVLLNQFDEHDELLMYTLNGTQRAITVADFATWMPELLPSELINRPGASLGRVMRNEVLYELGKKKGYDTDKRVRYDLDLRTNLFASDIVMEKMIQSIRSDSSSIDEQAFEMFLKSKSEYQWKIKYTAKVVSSVQEAKEVKQQLETQRMKPSTQWGFSTATETISTKHVKYKMLKDAPLSTWSVGADNTGVLYVYKVDSKEQIEKKFEADDKFKLLFRSYEQIRTFSDSLKKQASVKVDSAQFERAMRF